MFKPAGTRQDVIDEAMALLEMLKLADDAHHTHSRTALWPPAAGRARHRARARSPKVLLLDEPAAGVPSAESHIILDAIDALPKDIGVLIIDHDMDLVFRFAETHHGAGARRDLRRRHAEGDRRQPGRARRLSRAGHAMV